MKRRERERNSGATEGGGARAAAAAVRRAGRLALFSELLVETNASAAAARAQPGRSQPGVDERQHRGGPEREAGEDTNRRIQLEFLLTTGRPPDTKSRGTVRDFLISQRKLHLGAKDAEFRTWADLCQMLLASSPFLYLD